MIVPVLSVDDNTFLNERYRENIKATTPSGMFYDRDINGLWCAAEGVVYKDFNQDVHYISESRLQEINMVKYFAGVDFGYEHYGAIIVIGEDDKGNFYLLEEHTKQFEEIDYWVDVAIDIKGQYGNVNFFVIQRGPNTLNG